ncbi:MAG: phosphohydrolase [Dethiosulfovibrio peptidovorans]|nr:MAG: phosphohydrolase [Dethiosulfovibrio peptidovorans]
MGLVSTSHLAEGMILADNLMTPSGRLILSKGVSLTGKHISMMKVWGISFADVEGVDQEDIRRREQAVQETMDQSDLLLRSFFPSLSDEGPTSELFDLCRRRCARLIDKGENEMIEEMADDRRPETIPFRSDLPTERPRLSELVSEEIPLASLSDIHFKIREVVQSPVSSAASIARVVSTDPNLSLRLLRLVNSAFYAFPTPIRSIPRAIAIVGVRELSSLALAVSTMNVFTEIPSEYADMKSFWKHAVACGVLARILAVQKKIRRDEQYFLAGLLHDIGRAVLYIQEPRWMAHALGLSRYLRLPLLEVERRLLGFDHAVVTHRLLSAWKIPEPILGLASWHHEPERAEYPEAASLIWLADWIANAMKVGTSGAFFLPPLDDHRWELTGLHSEALRSVFGQAERQIQEVLRIFLIK